MAVTLFEAVHGQGGGPGGVEQQRSDIGLVQWTMKKNLRKQKSVTVNLG